MLTALAESTALAEPTAPEGQEPKVRVHLPDHDTRTAAVLLTKQQGDVLDVCIRVTPEPPKATLAETEALARWLLQWRWGIAELDADDPKVYQAWLAARAIQGEFT